MHWRCSNENAAKKRHAHSAPTAFMAGSSVAFHIAANVWDSPVVGTLAIFDRARREVLDGTERLSSPLPIWELVFVGLNLVVPFFQFGSAKGIESGRFLIVLLASGKIFAT